MFIIHMSFSVLCRPVIVIRHRSLWSKVKENVSRFSLNYCEVPKVLDPPPPLPKVATLESSGILKVRRRTRSIHGQNSQRDRENRIRVGPIITCSRRSDFEMAHRCEREKQRKVRRGGLFFFSLSDVTACRCIHCLKRF